MDDSQFQNLRVLVVDDSPDIAELLAEHLDRMGFGDIDTVDNGLEAYNLCVKQCADGKKYDIVVSDFKMPKMTGLELLRKIRNNALLEETPFVIITGFAEEPLVKESMSLQLNDFITKPFQPETIEKKFTKIAGRIRR